MWPRVVMIEASIVRTKCVEVWFAGFGGFRRIDQAEFICLCLTGIIVLQDYRTTWRKLPERQQLNVTGGDFQVCGLSPFAGSVCEI